MSREPLDEKLSRVTFVRAPEPHISLDEAVCRRCSLDRVCLTTCPAGNFKRDERSGQVSVSTESCMECGSCRIVCALGAVRWKLPKGGFGVCYLRG
ncbi:MAG: 4Fe-4S dicluster domain-containing protein [Elusimicrobia bacterium]|nr:4Fe-4S dicluster domain-containing protein [Elusimicrobiota bacterium]